MKTSSCKESVQIVSIDNERDLDYAKGNCGVAFYKFPVIGNYPKKECRYVAFYLADEDCFGKYRRGIIYYTLIKKYTTEKLGKIHKDFLDNSNKDKLYFKIELSELKQLDSRIENKLGHRVSYRYTSLDKLNRSKDVSELTLNKQEKNKTFRD